MIVKLIQKIKWCASGIFEHVCDFLSVFSGLSYALFLLKFARMVLQCFCWIHMEFWLVKNMGEYDKQRIINFWPWSYALFALAQRLSSLSAVCLSSLFLGRSKSISPFSSSKSNAKDRNSWWGVSLLISSFKLDSYYPFSVEKSSTLVEILESLFLS